MGRIKSKVIKRTSRQLLETTDESFGDTFEHNKKSLRGTLPSKKVRNKIAGYITRLKKSKKNILPENHEAGRIEQ